MGPAKKREVRMRARNQKRFSVKADAVSFAKQQQAAGHRVRIAHQGIRDWCDVVSADYYYAIYGIAVRHPQQF